MWDTDPKQALKMVFYNRMISRTVKGFAKSDNMQSGQGNKDEFRKCIIWIARYYPAVLNKNMWLIPLVGCWKDLWHEDLLEDLDTLAVYQLIERGMHCEYNADLIAKYLPRIRSDLILPQRVKMKQGGRNQLVNPTRIWQMFRRA